MAILYPRRYASPSAARVMLVSTPPAVLGRRRRDVIDPGYASAQEHQGRGYGRLGDQADVGGERAGGARGRRK